MLIVCQRQIVNHSRISHAPPGLGFRIIYETVKNRVDMKSGERLRTNGTGTGRPFHFGLSMPIRASPVYSKPKEL